MTKLKATIALALVSAIIAASGTTVQAAPLAEMHHDLPILVDLHYELKDPAGPVSTTLVPAELKDPYIVRTVPVVDIHDIPNPRWEQQIVVGR